MRAQTSTGPTSRDVEVCSSTVAAVLVDEMEMTVAPLLAFDKSRVV